MAQFEVYQKPSRKTRQAYPYLVDIQSDFLSALNSRLVIPLAQASELDNSNLQVLIPAIRLDQESLILLTPQLTSVPAGFLDNPVGTLAHLRGLIVAAIDFAITGY